MTLQIAPGEFDIIEFGSVFRQPLDREPGTGGERLAGQPAGVDRTVVEDENHRPRCPAKLRPEWVPEAVRITNRLPPAEQECTAVHG
jgi:hypothetical protein